MWCSVLLKSRMLSHLVLFKVKHIEHMISKAQAFYQGHNQRCIEITHATTLFSLALRKEYFQILTFLRETHAVNYI
jgi:hypothetical protein